MNLKYLLNTNWMFCFCCAQSSEGQKRKRSSANISDDLAKKPKKQNGDSSLLNVRSELYYSCIRFKRKYLR